VGERAFAEGQRLIVKNFLKAMSCVIPRSRVLLGLVLIQPVGPESVTILLP
jgi:hypothetical protein